MSASTPKKSRLWKLVGLAGLAGVAATGVLVARDDRRRAHVTPDQVRARLQARAAQADASRPSGATG